MGDLLTARTALRTQVCADCFRRPDAVDSPRAGEAYSCEPSCDLFTYLPRLVGLVHRFGGEPPCGYESAIHSLPCRKCISREGEEDKCCAERPLEKYAGEALAALEWIERHRND